VEIRIGATARRSPEAIKDEKVQMIDLRFTDLPGVWQTFFRPAEPQ